MPTPSILNYVHLYTFGESTNVALVPKQHKLHIPLKERHDMLRKDFSMLAFQTQNASDDTRLNSIWKSQMRQFEKHTIIRQNIHSFISEDGNRQVDILPPIAAYEQEQLVLPLLPIEESLNEWKNYQSQVLNWTTELLSDEDTCESQISDDIMTRPATRSESPKNKQPSTGSTRQKRKIAKRLFSKPSKRLAAVQKKGIQDVSTSRNNETTLPVKEKKNDANTCSNNQCSCGIPTLRNGETVDWCNGRFAKIDTIYPRTSKSTSVKQKKKRTKKDAFVMSRLQCGKCLYECERLYHMERHVHAIHTLNHRPMPKKWAQNTLNLDDCVSLQR
eukprot:3128718-Rhodomonas_salina.2